VAAALAEDVQLLGMGWTSGSSSSDSVHTRMRFALEPGAVADGESLFIGFLDAEAFGAGLDVLHLSLELDGETVLDLSFDDPLTAMAELDDGVIALAASEFFSDDPVELVLNYFFGFAPGESGAFTRDFVLFSGAPVPEPSTSVVAGLALLAVLFRRGLVRVRSA